MSFINKKVILIISFIFLSIITVASLSLSYYLWVNKDTQNELSNDIVAINMDTKKEETVVNSFYVEIKGAVKKPGVYEVEDGSIIKNVVDLAGGFTSKAWTKNINLSKRATKELVIYVFTKNEYNEIKNKNDNKTIESPTVSETVVASTCECESNGYLIDNCTDENISIITSSENVEPEIIVETVEESNGIVNINKATIEELMTLPGIGEAKAKAIIEYRNTNGLFNSTEDIMNISGISDKTYEKFKELITV